MIYRAGPARRSGYTRHTVLAARADPVRGRLAVWLDIPDSMPRAIVAADVWALRRYLRCLTACH